MKKCTWCGREYPDQAKTCELDQHRLVSLDGGQISEPEPEPEEVRPVVRRRAAPEREMVVGGLVCVAGLLVTVITYEMASGGGTYFVAWGAIVFGALRFYRGLAGLKKNQELTPEADESYRADNAQSLLSLAARLEDKDREQAIAKYQEVIALFPGTSASAEAERNIKVLTAYAERPA